MDSSDLRFSMTAERYLDQNYVTVYLNDAIMQLLQHKDDNPKVNVTKFFSDYFTSVREGNHVLFREFAFIRATPHNRASFIRTFWKCFRNIGRKGDLLSVHEYHSLVCLLCPDFPFSIIQKTARIILMEDAMDCLISFSDFLYAFQVQFCFDEFLARCADVYKEVQQNPLSGPDTVVVPTSEETPTTPRQAAGVKGQSVSDVDAMHFFRALISASEKVKFDTPALPVLREVLSSDARVSFYGFLMALAKSDKLNTAIGKLPAKANILDTPDQELTSSQTKPSVAMATANRKPDSTSSHPSANHVMPPIRPSSAAKLRRGLTDNLANQPGENKQTEDKTTVKPSGLPITTNITTAAANSSTALQRNLVGRPPRRSRPVTGKRQNRLRQMSSSDDDDDDDDSGSSTN